MTDNRWKRYELYFGGLCSTGVNMDTDGYVIDSGFNLPRPTVDAKIKIRCIYCKQKQDYNNDVCEYCGAPLPD